MNTSTPLSTSQKGNSLIIVLVGILVLALIGGAYYLGQQSQIKATQETAVLPSLSPSPTLDPTVTINYSPSPSVNKIPKANLLSTTGWIRVNSLTYSVMVPPKLDITLPTNGYDLINLRYDATKSADLSLDKVDESKGWTNLGYHGESLQSWFSKWLKQTNYPDYQIPNYTTSMKMFGNITGLEAIPPSNSFQSIIIFTSGGNLYFFGSGLQYLSTLETVVSTFKNI